MSRILINEQLYIQEDHNIFNPTPLIPLPSVSFQCKTFRPMLVRGKMFAPSPSKLTLKNERDSALVDGGAGAHISISDS